jgi:hypothetical protein
MLAVITVLMVSMSPRIRGSWKISCEMLVFQRECVSLNFIVFLGMELPGYEF